ncbi:MAG: fructosamine kinase family protein [Alkalispirochaetaceae bacterium]
MITDVGSLEEAINRLYGSEVSVSSRRGVGVGSINQTALLSLSNGESLFLKENSRTHKDLFRAEAAGLEALRAADGPRVPEPRAVFESGSRQYLLMEAISPGSRGGDFFERFGSALARLHETNRADSFGFSMDNHIGSTRQNNPWTREWHLFFGEHRLLFQVRLASGAGLADSSMVRGVEQIVAKLPQLLPEPEHPALLHGDLWGGNYMVDEAGEPVLIDPAVYYGHREADLAMTELFGGFTDPFYRAYGEAYPLQPGYRDRVDLYNLYHLLNHLNLFGGGYASSCRSIIRRYA